MHRLTKRGESRTALCRATPASTTAPMNQQRRKSASGHVDVRATLSMINGSDGHLEDDQLPCPAYAQLHSMDNTGLTNLKPILAESVESARQIFLYKYVAAHSSC